MRGKLFVLAPGPSCDHSVTSKWTWVLRAEDIDLGVGGRNRKIGFDMQPALGPVHRTAIILPR